MARRSTHAIDDVAIVRSDGFRDRNMVSLALSNLDRFDGASEAAISKTSWPAGSTTDSPN